MDANEPKDDDEEAGLCPDFDESERRAREGVQFSDVRCTEEETHERESEEGTSVRAGILSPERWDRRDNVRGAGYDSR